MKNITVYSTPTCVYCKLAKEFLDKNNIKYASKDVSLDAEAREEMFKKSHQMGVPVIDVDGEIVVGFDQQTLSRLVGIE